MQIKYIKQVKSKTDTGDSTSFQYVKAQQGLLYKNESSRCYSHWFIAIKQQDVPDFTPPMVGARYFSPLLFVQTLTSTYLCPAAQIMHTLIKSSIEEEGREPGESSDHFYLFWGI